VSTVERADPEADFITVESARWEIGGEKPISTATFYRGVKRGLYPAPIHISPGLVRVDRRELRRRRGGAA
jgi:hypothetical protein